MTQTSATRIFPRTSVGLITLKMDHLIWDSNLLELCQPKFPSQRSYLVMMPTKLEQGLAERKRLCRSQDDASWEHMDATVSEVNFMPLDFGVREP